VPPLQAASLEGDEETVHILLEIGVDVNTEAQPYGTALHAASVSGHYPVVCMLLAYGANVNSQSGMYGTPLRAASLAGHADIVRLLLDNGAEIDAQAGNHGSALAAVKSWRCCSLNMEPMPTIQEHVDGQHSISQQGMVTMKLCIYCCRRVSTSTQAQEPSKRRCRRPNVVGSEIASLLIKAGAKADTER
jgi:ankyrin repeat protein